MVRALIAVVLTAPALAAAQPADPDRLPGEDPPEAPPPPTGYPLELAQRPFVLPSGMIEVEPGVSLSHRAVIDPISPGSTTVTLGHATDLAGELSARAGVAGFVIAARASTGLHDSAIDAPLSNRFWGGGGDVTYGLTEDLAVTASFDASVRLKRVHLYTPELSIATKLHASPRSAILFYGIVGDSHHTVTPSPSDTVFAGASVLVEAQVSRRFAVDARGFYGVYHELDPDRLDTTMPDHATYFAGNYSAGFVAALSPALDLDGEVTLVSTSSAFLEYSLSLVVRRVP